jgi:hypothetical protein
MQTNPKPSRMNAKALQAVAWVGCMGILFLFSGCVSAHKKARTIHEIKQYQISPGKYGYPTAFLTRDEIWLDENKGGGVAFFSDPKASQFSSVHTNQAALGGVSILTIGSVQSEVSTNGILAAGAASSQIIQGIGAAVGQAANKAVTGTPIK